MTAPDIFALGGWQIDAGIYPIASVPKIDDDVLCRAARAYEHLMYAAEIASERGELCDRLLEVALMYRAAAQGYRRQLHHRRVGTAGH